jgi:hypothetical protein
MLGATGEACAALLALWDALPGWCQSAADRLRAGMSRTTSGSTPDSSHNAGAQYYHPLPAEELPPEYWSHPRHEGPPPLSARCGGVANA